MLMSLRPKATGVKSSSESESARRRSPDIQGWKMDVSARAERESECALLLSFCSIWALSGWDDTPSTLGRAVCLTQLTLSNVNLIWKDPPPPGTGSGSQ